MSELELPDVLFDGYAVYQALTDRERRFTTPENVSAVLDAVVRLAREQHRAPAAQQDARPEPEPQAPALPIMARRPEWPAHVVGAAYDHRGDLCLTDSLERADYRIADTDERGLPVIPWAEWMPDDARYYVSNGGERYFRQRYEPFGREAWRRVEDYRPAAQESGGRRFPGCVCRGPCNCG